MAIYRGILSHARMASFFLFIFNDGFKTLMSLSIQELEKLASLAKLKIEPAQTSFYLSSLSNIIDMISKMEKVNTDHIVLHDDPSKAQYLREDKVTEPNQVELTQLSSEVMAGLYLVPAVIENAN